MNAGGYFARYTLDEQTRAVSKNRVYLRYALPMYFPAHYTQQLESPLKMQTRTVARFVNKPHHTDNTTNTTDPTNPTYPIHPQRR